MPRDGAGMALFLLTPEGPHTNHTFIALGGVSEAWDTVKYQLFAVTSPTSPCPGSCREWEFTKNLTGKGSWRCQPIAPRSLRPWHFWGLPGMSSPGSPACLDGLLRSENSRKKDEEFIPSSDNELLVQHGNTNKANLG